MMKFASMNTRDRRALLLGAFIVIPGLFVPFVAKPYLHMLSEIKEQTADERDKLKREQRAIVDLPTLPAVRAQASRRLDAELGRLFQASNDFLATADLAQYVATVSQDNGLQLQTSETGLPYPVVSGVQALRVEVHAEGDLDGILHFLYQLESGDKLVRIEALTIADGSQVSNRSAQTTLSANRALGGDRDDVSETRAMQNVEVLSLSASVYGYRLSDVPQPDTDTQNKGAPSPFPHTTYSLGALNTVLDHDLFSASRTRPSISYRLAMLDAARHQLTQTTSSQKPYQQPNLRLIGTVAGAGNASFVLCQNGGASVQVVHVGEHIAGYTLTTVHREAAVFTGAGGEHLVLQLQQESSQSNESRRLRRHHHPSSADAAAIESMPGAPTS
jgi:hypothetical protein